jgi:hypothetical protein
VELFEEATADGPQYNAHLYIMDCHATTHKKASKKITWKEVEVKINMFIFTGPHRPPNYYLMKEVHFELF